MNKYEKQGYEHCTYDYKNFGIKFCMDELKRMLELTNGVETSSYKGYKMALDDMHDKKVGDK